jgi:hypothetical protein
MYFLGEFGHLIEDHASSKSQFALLYSRFNSASYPIQALLLSTFMKMWNLYPHLKPAIDKVIKPYDFFCSKIPLLFLIPNFRLRSFIDDELQQRAVEYNEMLDYSNQDLMVGL